MHSLHKARKIYFYNLYEKILAGWFAHSKHSKPRQSVFDFRKIEYFETTGHHQILYDTRRGQTSSNTIAAVAVKPVMAAEAGGSVDASKGGELRLVVLVDLVGWREIRM